MILPSSILKSLWKCEKERNKIGFKSNGETDKTINIMARNKVEQIAFLIRRRNSGMSASDFKKELEYLYETGVYEGRDYYIPTMSTIN